MSRHIQFMKELTALSKEKLLQRFQKQRQYEKPEDSTSDKIVAIRLDSITIDGFQYFYHRILVQCVDSKDYYKTGWILQRDINFCMICKISFKSALSVSNRHHCRACGNIVCSRCSNYTAIISSLQELGKVRVCRLCYFEQDIVDAHNSLLDGTPIQGRNGSFTEYIAMSKELGRPKQSTVSNVLLQKEKEKIAIMEKCLLERQISDLTLQFDDYSSLGETSETNTKELLDNSEKVEENSYFPRLHLRDYGQLSIKQINPHYVLRIFSKQFNPVNTPNTQSKHSIFINICSCESIPVAPKPTSPKSPTTLSDKSINTIKSSTSEAVVNPKSPLPSPVNDLVETFCIIFGTIIENTHGHFVMDCAVNPRLIDETKRNPEMLGELCLQVTIGASFLRSHKSEPFYQKYELIDGIPENYAGKNTILPHNHSPSPFSENESVSTGNDRLAAPPVSIIPKQTSIPSVRPYSGAFDPSVPKMIVLVVPSISCSLALRYVYTKYADLSDKDRTKDMNMTQLQTLMMSSKKLEQDYMASIRHQITLLRKILIFGPEKSPVRSNNLSSISPHDELTEIHFDDDVILQSPPSAGRNRASEGAQLAEGEKHVRFSNSDHLNEKKEKKRFSAILSSMIPHGLSKSSSTETGKESQYEIPPDRKTARSVLSADSDNNYSSKLSIATEKKKEIEAEGRLSHGKTTTEDEGNATEKKKGGGKIIKGVRKIIRNSISVFPSALKPPAKKGGETDKKASEGEEEWYYEERGTLGHKFLTKEMFNNDHSSSPTIDYRYFRNATESISLKNEILAQPNKLLGWQVRIMLFIFLLSFI